MFKIVKQAVTITLISFVCKYALYQSYKIPPVLSTFYILIDCQFRNDAVKKTYIVEFFVQKPD